MYPKSTELDFEYSAGGRIRYAIRDGSGPTFLMLHGFGASLETWTDVSPLLPNDWRLVLVDLKGFGSSSKPRDGAYSIFDQAAVIIALANHLKLQDYVIVGHSYGGSVAMATYLANAATGSRNEIRSLILIDSPCYPQSFPLFIKLLRAPLLNRISQNVTSARFRARYILNQIFYDTSLVTSERVDRYARYFDLPGIHDVMIDSARQIVPTDPKVLTDRIREVSVPTLIIWGQNDPLIRRWQAERLHKEIRTSTLVILPACGHVPHEECPEAVAASLKKFIH